MPACPRCKAVSDGKFCASCGQSMSVSNNDPTRFLMICIGAVCVMALIVAILKSSIPATPAWNNQVYGEVPSAPKVFALKPGQWMRFGPFIPAGGNIRYDLRSSAPVNTGLVSSGGNWPQNATCYEPQVLGTVKSCTVDQSAQEWIFVADSRAFGFTPTQVTLTTYQWGCVRNCVDKP